MTADNMTHDELFNAIASDFPASDKPVNHAYMAGKLAAFAPKTRSRNSQYNKVNHTAKARESQFVVDTTITKTIPWRMVSNKKDVLHVGRRFIVGGLISVIAADYGKRVKIVRANGTEIDMLRTSLVSSMYKCRTARLLVD